MKEAGCRLLIVGFESGDPQILKNIKKGATVERARAFAKDCHDLGLTIHGDFILGLPGETKESIRNTINFAKTLDCETIQVSIAHAYPGTEFYDYAKANGFIANDAEMKDEGGHQMAHIEYPGLPTDYVLEMVHRFYDEYYFRPKAAFRVVWKALSIAICPGSTLRPRPSSSCARSATRWSRWRAASRPSRRPACRRRRLASSPAALH